MSPLLGEAKVLLQPNILKSFKIHQIQYVDNRKGGTFVRTLSPEFVPPEFRGGSSVKCPHCKESIRNAGALSQHIMWNHSQLLSSPPPLPSNTLLNDFVTIVSPPKTPTVLSSCSSSSTMIEISMFDTVVEMDDCIVINEIDGSNVATDIIVGENVGENDDGCSLPKNLLFCDNLDLQVHEGFLSAFHDDIDSSRYCLPPNETEMC